MDTAGAPSGDATRTAGDTSLDISRMGGPQRAEREAAALTDAAERATAPQPAPVSFEDVSCQKPYLRRWHALCWSFSEVHASYIKPPAKNTGLESLKALIMIVGGAMECCTPSDLPHLIDACTCQLAFPAARCRQCSVQQLPRAPSYCVLPAGCARAARAAPDAEQGSPLSGDAREGSCRVSGACESPAAGAWRGRSFRAAP